MEKVIGMGYTLLPINDCLQLPSSTNLVLLKPLIYFCQYNVILDITLQYYSIVMQNSLPELMVQNL